MSSNGDGRRSGPQSRAWRQLFRHQFRKTKLCRFFPTGECRYGQDCPYAHTDTELEHAPDLTKTALCEAFQKGLCNKSSNECQFAHGQDELRTTEAFSNSSLCSKRLGGRKEDDDTPGSNTDMDDSPSRGSPGNYRKQPTRMDSRQNSGRFSDSSPTQARGAVYNQLQQQLVQAMHPQMQMQAAPMGYSPVVGQPQLPFIPNQQAFDMQQYGQGPPQSQAAMYQSGTPPSPHMQQMPNFNAWLHQSQQGSPVADAGMQGAHHQQHRPGNLQVPPRQNQHLGQQPLSPMYQQPLSPMAVPIGQGDSSMMAPPGGFAMMQPMNPMGMMPPPPPSATSPGQMRGRDGNRLGADMNCVPNNGFMPVLLEGPEPLSPTGPQAESQQSLQLPISGSRSQNTFGGGGGGGGGENVIPAPPTHSPQLSPALKPMVRPGKELGIPSRTFESDISPGMSTLSPSTNTHLESLGPTPNRRDGRHFEREDEGDYECSYDDRGRESWDAPAHVYVNGVAIGSRHPSPDRIRHASPDRPAWPRTPSSGGARSPEQRWGHTPTSTAAVSPNTSPSPRRRGRGVDSAALAFQLQGLAGIFGAKTNQDVLAPAAGSTPALAANHSLNDGNPSAAATQVAQWSAFGVNDFGASASVLQGLQ